MTTNLPLIRLSAVNPLFLELKRRGIDVRSMLHDRGLPMDVPVSADLFVASDTVYELVENCAELSKDRFFGFAVGSSLDLPKWDPFANATAKATTVGELLTMFAVNAGNYSTATKFYISTAGERSTFGFERVRTPPIVPAQNDAFYTGFMERLLRHAAHENWRGADVLFRVADPDCIPTNGDVCRIAKGDRSGVQISFPSAWLFERFEHSLFCEQFENEQSGLMPQSLIDSLRIALRPHLQETDLTAVKAAKICVFNRRRLSRNLREIGTTLAKEIAHLRSEKATRALADTDQPIARIAEAVGFKDPTVFSRAFKKWTGQSPRDYRRTHRSPD